MYTRTVLFTGTDELPTSAPLPRTLPGFLGTLGLWAALVALPALAAAETVRFAAFGDYGADGTRERQVADFVDSLAVDFIITTGDNSYDSRPIDDNIGKYYASYIGNYVGDYGPGSPVNRFFPSLGNHDYDDGGGVEAYLEYFTLPGEGIETTNTSQNEHFYDFIMGPVHFFALNSNLHETEHSVQGQWLQTQLAASSSPWRT